MVVEIDDRQFVFPEVKYRFFEADYFIEIDLSEFKWQLREMLKNNPNLTKTEVASKLNMYAIPMRDDKVTLVINPRPISETSSVRLAGDIGVEISDGKAVMPDIGLEFSEWWLMRVDVNGELKWKLITPYGNFGKLLIRPLPPLEYLRALAELYGDAPIKNTKPRKRYRKKTIKLEEPLELNNIPFGDKVDESIIKETARSLSRKRDMIVFTIVAPNATLYYFYDRTCETGVFVIVDDQKRVSATTCYEEYTPDQIMAEFTDIEFERPESFMEFEECGEHGFEIDFGNRYVFVLNTGIDED